MDEAADEGEEAEADPEDGGADAAVDAAVELEIGAEEGAVVVGDGLVHRADDGLAEAELGEHEDAED